jgi:hypothetical protein
MTKNASVSSNWAMFDCMRGIVVGGDGPSLVADSSAAENGVLGSNKFVIPHGDGFSLKYGATAVNPGNGNNIIYVAIRRSDGYVGKPPELGTGVFAMDTGSNSSTIPTFDSGFPVDFAFQKLYASSEDWYTSARLMQGKYFFTNTNDAESSSGNMVFDSNAGWALDSQSTYQSWMWKRHAGFDVVCYEGNGVDRYISHSMNQSPEMMWFKKRNDSKNWYVYHSGLDGGSSPQNYSLRLNTTALEDEDGDTLWNQTAPTATHFRINTDNGVNTDGDDYIAMLFASVSGISKVGRYTGNGSNTGPIITTGFAPRFLIIRRAGPTEGDNWNVFDTVRGFSSSSDPLLKLNNSNAQLTGYDLVDPLSDGFQLVTTDSAHNSNNVNYIYYCHA